jgi:hypothetical protein
MATRHVSHFCNTLARQFISFSGFGENDLIGYTKKYTVEPIIAINCIMFPSFHTAGHSPYAGDDLNGHLLAQSFICTYTLT